MSLGQLLFLVALWAHADGGRGSDFEHVFGNEFCWRDPSFNRTSAECCRPDATCFAAEQLSADAGLPIVAPFYGVFAEAKCCQRRWNESSFYGFVNPVMHDATWIDPKSWTAQIMDQVAVRLPTPGGRSSLWNFAHSDGEVPKQVAWELHRFRSDEARFRTNYEVRRKAYRLGHHACYGQLETLGSAVLDLEAFMHRLREVLAWTSDAQTRFVNIGANNGVDGDPLGTVVTALPAAWAVAGEMDPELCAAHRENLPHVKLWCGMVTPANAWEMMDAWLPTDDALLREQGMLIVDVLKVDIDSYDCALVETFLKGTYSKGAKAVLKLRPKIIVMEVNDAIPPPLQMALLYNPATANTSLEDRACGGNIPLAGCSLSYQVHHLAHFGFKLVLFSTGNTVFAHESVLDKLAEAGILGPLDEFECYWHTPIASQCAPGRLLRRWFHESPEPWEALSEVWRHLKALEGRFNLPQMPFTLEL